jgi:formylmethanofuran dehydrogenase subunit E
MTGKKTLIVTAQRERVMNEVTYCEVCLENFTDDDDFNHRFDYPVCLSCADKMEVLV